MFWGILHRSILFDLFKIFSMALVALTGLILLAGVISEAMKNGMSPGQILMAIPLLLPTMLPYTVPTTTLFATCIVYGRLAADNEIVALKSAGVHLVHIVWPAVFLGLVASALTMFVSLDVIPCAHSVLKTQIAADVEEILYSMLRKDGCLKHPKMNYEIYVKSVHGRTLCDAQFMRRSRDGSRFDAILRAKEAELIVDLLHKRILVDVRQCQFAQNNGNIGFVQEQIWPVDLPSDLNGTFVKSRATDMTWSEMSEYRDKWLREKQAISLEIDRHQLAINVGRAPPHFAAHVYTKVNERKNLDNQIFAIDCEFHMRPAFALGCLCFALIGCPVGIWFSKSDYLSAFMTCFLPIVTIYYPVMFCLINSARNGKIPPWLGIYDADIALAVVGLVLFRRLTKT